MKKFTFLIIVAMFFTAAAQGQITQKGTATTSTTITTGDVVITKPTGLALNDVMIVQIVQSNNSGNALTDASGSGFTFIAGSNIRTDGNNEVRATLLYKVATAGDVAASNFSFDLDPDASGVIGAMLAYSGVDVVGGVNESGILGGPFAADPAATYNNIADDNQLNANALTNSSVQSAVIMFGVIGNDGTDFTSWSAATAGTLNEAFDLEVNVARDISSGAAWAIQQATGTTGAGTASFGITEWNGSILASLKPLVVFTANLWSVSGTGPIRNYTVNPVTGAITYGPNVVLASPSTSTAAVGKMLPNANDPDGCIYYLNRDDASTQNGVVTVYSVRPDGTGNGSRGTIDMNGASNDDFSYVRLAFTQAGRGYIIAGSGTNIYIASFQGNGVNPISSINTYGNIILTVASPGSATEFQNGDLAISGNGVLYALANVTDGDTYVYTLNSLVTPTTLTRKWTVQQGGNQFSGSVNGLAWTSSGSLHFSTSTGIYFIDQFTANIVSGTVQATLVPNSGGLDLTDLASASFPTQSTLPVTLLNFSGSFRNDQTTLNWEAENMINFDRFEIERSSDGSNFSPVGVKTISGNISNRTAYTHYDNLAGVSGNVFYYRLKMVDMDGQFKYSNVILVRKDVKSLTGIILNPNPVRSDVATLRFDAIEPAKVNITVLDLSGKVMLRQTNQAFVGTNSIPVSGLGRLQAGTYILQMTVGLEVQTTKFVVTK